MNSTQLIEQLSKFPPNTPLSICLCEEYAHTDDPLNRLEARKIDSLILSAGIFEFRHIYICASKVKDDEIIALMEGE